MTSRHYFALSLLLPVLGALVGYMVSKVEFLLFIFTVCAIPYVPVAIGLAIFITRARSLRALVRLSVIAPVLFAAAFFVFVLSVGRVPEVHLTANQYIAQAWEAVVLGTVFAGAYVALAWGLWAVARRLGWVRNEFAI